MATRQNRGNRADGSARAVELSNVPSHAHEVAAHSHDQQEHLTGTELSHNAHESRHHPVTFGHNEISELAHKLWHGRGCPDGSSDQDWHEAVRQLRESALKG